MLSTSQLARHWPEVVDHLAVRRIPPATLRALTILAWRQAEADGAHVSMSALELKRFRLTAGEASNVRRILPRMAAAGVVSRVVGAGRFADRWSLVADLEHWRALPWAAPRGLVRGFFLARESRALSGVAARSPGTKLASFCDLGEMLQNWPSGEMRPGLLPVETRGFPGDRAERGGDNSRRPGLLPGVSGDDASSNGPHTAFLERAKALSVEEEERRGEKLASAIAAASGAPGLKGRPLVRAQALAVAPGADVDALCARAASMTGARFLDILEALEGPEGAGGRRAWRSPADSDRSSLAALEAAGEGQSEDACELRQRLAMLGP